VERAVHDGREAGDRRRDLLVLRLGDVEERGVSFEVDEPEPGRGVDDGMEQRSVFSCACARLIRCSFMKFV
jgi:hypothetical protein